MEKLRGGDFIELGGPAAFLEEAGLSEIWRISVIWMTRRKRRKEALP